jgi:hypothetical protein
LYPDSFSAGGGGTLQITGKGFTSDVNPGEFNCRFTGIKGDQRLEKIVPAKFDSETKVLCSIPGGWEDVDNIEFGISFNGIDYTTFETNISMYTVGGLSPQSSPEGGSSAPFTVWGSGFKSDTDAMLYINNEAIQPESITDDLITFKPFKPSPGTENFIGSYEMELTVNGVDFIKFPDGFSVYK